jgi:hypothetical protein
MSKADKAELHAIQLQALEYLQNLRSFEVSGTDVQVGSSTEAIQEGTGCANAHLLLYWSNPVSQVLRAMAFKRTTRGRSNFGELVTAKIS